VLFRSSELIRRFDKAPKPMSYQPEFLTRCWDAYLLENKLLPGEVDPDSFIRWAYSRALPHRQPRYAAMAKWGITVTAQQIAALSDAAGFDDLIAQTLEMRAT